MQRRFYLGLGLLILLLVLCLAATIAMEAVHSPIEAELLRASRLALEGDMEQAVPIAKKAHEKWASARCFTASIADHSPMDDAENLFAEMEVYAEAGESAHFAACCRQLGNMARAMYEAHSLTLWNLL